MPFDDDTYGWAYAPPSHLEGEPAVPIPDRPPGAEIAPNRPVHLPSGVVAYRQTYAEHDRLAELDRQREQARRAAEQAAMDAKMFAQMSRVATSMKDIEIARRNIDAMALQRDIQSGVPIHEAVGRHPMALGSSYGSALQHTAPAPVVPAPSVVNLPGMPPAVRSGRYGERVQFAPASTIEAPLDTKGEVLKDPESGKRIGTTYRTGPHSQRIVLDELPKGVTAATANSIYSAQERGLMKELEDIEARAALLNPKNAKYEYYKGLQDQLKTVRQNRAALIQAPATNPTPKGPTGPILTLPKNPTPKDMVQDGLYDIKGTIYRWDGKNLVKVQTR